MIPLLIAGILTLLVAGLAIYLVYLYTQKNLGATAGILMIIAVVFGVAAMFYHGSHPKTVKASYDVSEPTEGPLEFEAYSQQLLGIATQQCAEKNRNRAVRIRHSEVLACHTMNGKGCLKWTFSAMYTCYRN